MPTFADHFSPAFQEASDTDTLGGRIWRARDAMSLSPRALADRLGVRPETISAWERDRAEPRTNRLFMLAGVLGVTPAWLIAGLGEAPKDDISAPAPNRLREQLTQVRRLHEQTGQAIVALEQEINRALAGIR